ncbi:MAG: SAM-dependent methyltransferase [Rhodobacteraceae bacterium]|nr:SAM-dependent methyltransferase [Paracoccaceae bacterium]
MTALAAALAARIRATGPLRIDEFMAACLLDPGHGYYATRDPLGAAGDFVTAPEISQMFGELVGLALAQAWLDQGRPAPFVLAELGPGRGTLMADLWRAAAVVPGFRAAARVVLVEASPPLRAAQGARLAALAPAHVATVAAIPAGPLFLVANEFFDALPVRQFVRDGALWRERMVALAGDRLAFALGPAVPVAALARRLADTLPGTTVELGPAGAAIAAAVAARIARDGGAAIVIDYGGWRSRGDTLQAVARHAAVDPLAAPGAADLTAHVDFEALAEAVTAEGARATPLVGQGTFLLRLGIGARAEVLAAGLAGAALAAHRAGLRRLTDPAEMGNLFRVLGVHAPGAPPPPGLDAPP